MIDDPLAFTDEKQPVAPAAPEVKPVEPTPPAQPAPPAAPGGTVKTDEGHTVPLPKYLDTYHELREVRQRLKQLEEEKQGKAELPDALLDPEGFAAHQQRVLEENLWDQRCHFSEMAAKRFYGEEVVNEAFKALQAQSDPLVGMRIRQSPDPWDHIVKWYKREKLLQEVGEDAEAYKARIIAEHQAQQANGAPPAEPHARTPDGRFAAQTQQARAAPPASLSRAPSGHKAADVPTGPGQAFDSTFAHR